MPDNELANEIHLFTEMVRESLNQHAPEAIQSVDLESRVYLGVVTGFVGSFEFEDKNGQPWSVNVKPSERLR